MKPNELCTILFTRNNLIRLILLIFGFTLFPALVFYGKALLFPSSETISDYYAKIYGALMDWSMDGMLAWCVVCTPYLIYDICLIVKDFRAQRLDADE